MCAGVGRRTYRNGFCGSSRSRMAFASNPCAISLPSFANSRWPGGAQVTPVPADNNNLHFGESSEPMKVSYFPARAGSAVNQQYTSDKAVLLKAGAVLDYAVVRNAPTLMDDSQGPHRALIAARVGPVRLIDNCAWPAGW